MRLQEYTFQLSQAFKNILKLYNSLISVTEIKLADAPKDWTDGVLKEFEYWRALQNKKPFLWVHYELAERAINFHLS